MPKFNVQLSMPVHLNIQVEADDEESAIEEAQEHAWLSSYTGNGGTDKLIGTDEACVSIEPGECVLEGDGWSITAERCD